MSSESRFNPELAEQLAKETETKKQHPEETEADFEVEQTERKRHGRDAVKRRLGLDDSWMSNKEIRRELKSDYETVKYVADKLKADHSEWIKSYKTEKKEFTFYSPEMVSLVKAEIQRQQSERGEPEGWETRNTLSTRINVNIHKIEHIAQQFRESYPEWFQKYRTEANGSLREHYSPELIVEIQKIIEEASELEANWIRPHLLATKLLKTTEEVNAVAEKFRASNPEWFKVARAGRLNVEYISQDLAREIRNELGRPEGWSHASKVMRLLNHKTSREYLKKEAEKYRTEHPEWFKGRNINGRDLEYYSPELTNILVETLNEFEKIPDDWKDASSLVYEFGINYRTISQRANKYREDHPEWVRNLRTGKGYPHDYYSPELIEILRQSFVDDGFKLKPREKKVVEVPGGFVTAADLRKQLGEKWSTKFYERLDEYRAERPDWIITHTNGADRFYSRELLDLFLAMKNAGPAEEGWMTKYKTAETLKVSEEYIAKIANSFRNEHPEWFKYSKVSNGAAREHYSPELLEKINEYLELKGPTRKGKLEKEFEIFAAEIADGKSIQANEFRNLVTLFGGSKAIDILYKFRPEFKGIPVDRVNRILANYLGEFLITRKPMDPESLEEGSKYLNDVSLQDGLREVIKESVLQFVFKKRTESQQGDIESIKQYIANLRLTTSKLGNQNLTEVIDQVEQYYLEVFALEKPDRIVDQIKDGRQFPDINQLVNIKEIKDKNRILIGDEMGLGKSASAILAKEYLGIEQALVVVPSNVVETWRKYLNTYFKEGQKPSVLIVEDLKTLETVNPKDYEYVIISQERLTDEYTRILLEKFDYGMTIVDEVHKIKNLKEGVRASNTVELAQSLGKDGKLALLSGTPVPNKVSDVAMIMRLLYPEKFEHLNNNELVMQIIRGDLVDLRSMLVPRMQMKELRASVEMPKLIEKAPIETDLSLDEKDIYEVLLEEDEITASEKIQVLRQFLLNPDLIDATPNVESTKIRALQQELSKDFESKNKIVVFVNGYIDGVIRGKKSVIEHLDLPEDVEIMVIEGEVSKAKREQIQRKLNNDQGRMLLLVSGQTADVGVDFSGGEQVYFYNEPWTKADKLQQLARVYRPGLKTDIESKTFITRNSIEEGINRYIEIKQRSIEKLLRGIPLTDLERELVIKAEKQVDQNLEVDPELAEYYFNSWDRLTRIFKEVFQLGEEDFAEYVQDYGRTYAECYMDLGARSYQSNAGRVTGTIISRMAKESGQDPKKMKILDIASGPEILKKHIGDEYKDSVFSMDINRWHFSEEGERRAVGSFTNLPIQDKSLDYANMSLALHYTKLIPSQGEYERVQVFTEMNRVLKTGGRGVVNLLYSIDLKDETKFKELVDDLGFKIVDKFTGEVAEGEKYKSTVITLEKIKDLEKDLDKVVDKIEPEKLKGLKFGRNNRKLKDNRKVLEEFKLNDEVYKTELNEADREILAEEKDVLEDGMHLKERWKSVKEIPKASVLNHGFMRFFNGHKYVLVKKLVKGSGVVVVS